MSATPAAEFGNTEPPFGISRAMIDQLSKIEMADYVAAWGECGKPKPADVAPPLACEECGAIGGTTRYTEMGDFCLACQPYREDGLYFSKEARARLADQ